MADPSRAARYTGYQETREAPENAELTHVRPGTPGGEYLRRFWHPVALASEVGDVPLLVRVLGEDLVLFRDLSGRYGLLHRHCVHRQASLEYGRCETRGLRCCYHGWCFDVDGALLEAPAEPADTPLRAKVRQPAYPVVVRNELVFAYLGPPEQQPPFPVYDTFDLADTRRVPYSADYPCNWLQITENAMDPVHSVFLHTRVNGPSFGEAWGRMSIREYHETPSGFYYTNGRRVGGHVWVRVHHVVLPNLTQAGAVRSMNGDTPRYFGRPVFTRWVVPVDDRNTRVLAWANFGPRSDEARPEWMTPRGIEIIEGGEPRTRPRSEAVRKPGDYEALSAWAPSRATPGNTSRPPTRGWPCSGGACSRTSAPWPPAPHCPDREEGPRATCPPTPGTTCCASRPGTATTTRSSPGCAARWPKRWRRRTVSKDRRATPG